MTNAIRLTIPFGVVMLMEGWLYPYYTKGPNSDIFAKVWSPHRLKNFNCSSQSGKLT